MTAPALQAVVFDLDGVLVDSEPAHYAASLSVVAPHHITPEEYERFIGLTLVPYHAWLRERFGLTLTLEETIARWALELERQPLPPIDGAHELIEACRTRGLAVGLCSNSEALWVRATLRASGLEGRFDATATGNEVAQGKPAPDVYLLAAERLGVDPAACLAIEDSAPGVASAQAAGMLVVQTRQTAHAAPPQPSAHLVVETLRDIDLDLLAADFAARSDHIARQNTER